MTHPALARMSAGVILPLFSLRTRSSAGLGGFLDAVPFLDWLRARGLKVWSLLPLNESSGGSGCPYTAVSAFAFDPAFLTLEAMADVKASPEAARLAREARKLDGAPAVDWAAVRKAKIPALRAAFDRFERAPGRRTAAFERFREEEAFWLADYAAFRAAKEEHGWSPWGTWPKGLREREAKALAAFRKAHAGRIRFFEWLQWQCRLQWEEVRAAAAERGVWLMGDLPFLVQGESADAWARPSEFSRAETVGAPPDMFNPEGQKWGVPAYVWRELERTGYAWWRERLRQAGRLYDLYRIDHVVGFFRTYVFGASAKGAYDIADEQAQEARGRMFLELAIEERGQAWPVAEDLGMVPPFVRKVMAELRIPGYKVLRWEKEDAGPYRDPAGYPPYSLAVTGTHDTDTLAEWWQTLPAGERTQLEAMLGLPQDPRLPFERVHEAAVGRLLGAGSLVALFPLQDLFGWTGRINVPGTVDDRANWTWRLPGPAEALDAEPGTRARGEWLKERVRRAGRG